MSRIRSLAARPRLRVAGVAVVLAGLAATPLAPARPAPEAEATGEAELLTRVREVAEDADGLHGLAVAEVRGDDVTAAVLGAADGQQAMSAATPIEIGSVAKALTGQLLADLAEVGELAPTDPVAEALDTDDPGLAAISLEDLATHHAGLPRLPPANLPRATLASVGGNPYAGWDRERLIDAAEGRDLDGSEAYAYSNFGVGLLGQALATHLDTSYPELFRARLTEPLGMDDTVVARTAPALPDGHAHGRTAAGLSADPWLGAGYAPAGVGVWSTAEDLATLVRALLAGEAPGTAALEPRRAAGDDTEIGLGWHRTAHDQATVTWHNGGTGGFSSFVGTDRQREHGVVVLARTTTSVDHVGLRLLGVEAEPRGEPGLLGLPFTVLLTAAVVGPPLVTAARGERATRPRDRAEALSTIAGVIAGLALLRALGSWQILTPAAWIVITVVTVAAIASPLARWPDLDTVAGSRPRRLASTGLSIAVSLALVAVLAWA
ncbi:serine hydrolase domain-containing protein [Egibacter rhizosphaerae]|uniref:serine hydrolase domain-containing protein n=1 Tax=Egibacter rhizosphaerae TaxID=1670831 RepID=UPI0013F15EA7|nr:serine hydrolase domain-containing protein [Egibacter rhizosphaerae]